MAIKMEVGPSAPPMIPIAAAYLDVNKVDPVAQINVKKTPN